MGKVRQESQYRHINELVITGTFSCYRPSEKPCRTPINIVSPRKYSGKGAVKHRGLRRKAVSMPKLFSKAADKPRSGPRLDVREWAPMVSATTGAAYHEMAL